MKRNLFLLLALLVIFAICSCQSTANVGSGGSGNGMSDGEYTYPSLNFNGDDIVVSNLERRGATHEHFVVSADETTDTLETAIYESNMRIEELFNFTLVEKKFPRGDWETMWIDQANDLIRNFNSGEDVYDFVFYAVNQYPDLIANGYILDLSDFEQLQLDQPWWDAQLNEDITINDRLYMTSGPINLMAYDNMACLIFNKSIIENNRLDSPYDMVRDGTWTLDALYGLATECVNLGTDEHYWILAGQGGTSTYGTGIHRDYPPYFLTSAGIRFVEETDGDYNLTVGSSDDFYLALDKITPFFTHCSSGGVGGGDASGGNNGRMQYFKEGRVAFCMISTIEAFDMRDTEIEFGFLPLPKLRVEQENYITSVEDHMSYLCIPTTSERPEDVASMLDALAYDRYKNVVPVYYDSYVTYKGVRDEDSLEMLEIMTEGRTVDIGVAYGWCYELITQKIGWNILSGNAASIIAGEEGPINERIDTFVKNYFN